MDRKASAPIVIIAAIVCGQAASASVIEYTDKAEWEAAVGGSFTTVDFILPPIWTPIDEQYAHLGVRFSGATFSHNSGELTYPNDEWGLVGFGGAWAHFDMPQHWLALDYPGILSIDLLFDGELIFSETYISSGGGNFIGLVSSIAFDEAHFYGIPALPELNNAVIDDLHFGNLIPGPGALGLLALAGLITPRRRRREAHAGCAPHTGDGSAHPTPR